MTSRLPYVHDLGWVIPKRLNHAVHVGWVIKEGENYYLSTDKNCDWTFGQILLWINGTYETMKRKGEETYTRAEDRKEKDLFGN